MGLLSKKDSKLILDPLADNNPITIQVLGICSALAVTTQMKPTLTMAISVIFVMVFANLAISLMRSLVPTDCLLACPASALPLPIKSCTPISASLLRRLSRPYRRNCLKPLREYRPRFQTLN